MFGWVAGCLLAGWFLVGCWMYDVFCGLVYRLALLPVTLLVWYVVCCGFWLLVVLEFLWVCGVLVVHVWSLWFAVGFVVCLLIVLLCGILLCLLCVCYFR